MFGIKKFLRGLRLVPKTTLESDQKGELEVDDVSGQLNYHNGSTRSPVITSAHSQTLTNKTVDADNNTISNLETDNLKSGVLNTDTSLTGATDTQIPSALAVKTFVENGLSAQNEASEITLVPTGTIEATDLQAAVAELDGDIQGHINDTVDAHDATAISYDGTASGLAATEVQAAIDEVDGRVDTLEVDVGDNAIAIADHINDTVDAHDASAISNVPAGTIAATDVQAAINELDGDIQGHVTASTDVHGIGATASVVGTDTTQTLTNKTIQGASIETPIRSDVKQDTKANLETYALTATNGQIVFATDSKEMFQIVDNVLVPVGAGGSEGDVDTLFIQNFETAALTDFTQTGLVLTETNPIRGDISARLVHDSLVNQSFKQVIPVDRKFRGVAMTVQLSARSTASSGNLIIQFRDETNALDLQESQQIIATSTIQTFQFGVTIPSDCDSFSYTITALPEAGSPESVIDDIVIRNYWMGQANMGQTEYQFEVPVVTEWVDAGPITITATTTNPTKGTTTTDRVRWRQVGEDYEVEYTYVQTSAGSSGSGQYLFSLPSGLEFDSSLILATNTDTNFGVTTSNSHINSSGTAAAGATGATVDLVSAYDSSTFRVGGQVLYSTAQFINNTLYGLGNTTLVYRFSIKFKGKNLKATETKKVISTDLVPAKALNGNASIEVPVVTGWQGYTPTFQGFGTPTNVEFEYRRVGENIEVRGKFVSGTTTAVEARVGLPAGFTSAGTGTIPSIQIVGALGHSVASTVFNSVLIEPNVNYVTFGDSSATGTINKLNASTRFAAGQTIGFFASVPCAGLTANVTETIGLAQSVLVQEADSAIYVNTSNGWGSTNTTIRRFSEIRKSLGTDITYSDSATLGGSFTINTSGVYTIAYTDTFSTARHFGISINSTALTTPFLSIPSSQKLVSGTTPLANYADTVTWTGFLEAGTVLRAHSAGDTPASNTEQVSLSITKQNAIKQVNVNPNQKITIPTSELRMEGASTRGSTATAIVRFDNIAKLRGDAFTVESDATLGTRITMRKAGKLDISASLRNSGGTCRISRNQAVLTALPTTSESLASESGTGVDATVAYSGFVSVGDIIRISADNTPTNATGNVLNLSFQEQDISVSVTNTLPQFSESDSSVRVDTANGYGSTGTRIRRFSNVRDNIGSDIEYVPSAVNGDTWLIKTTGLYTISYSDSFTGQNYFGIIKNPVPTVDPQSQSLGNILQLSVTSLANYEESASCQVYLQEGDVVAAMASGGTAVGSTNRSSFTISKVGKPNVTGVDVTPFINVPQATITEWVDAGPVQIGATTTAPTKGTTTVDNVRWRRVGQDYEVEYRFKQTTAGTDGSGGYIFTLPSGIEIDTTVHPTKANVGSHPGYTSDNDHYGIGTGITGQNGGGMIQTRGTIVPTSSTTFQLYGTYNAGSQMVKGSSLGRLGLATGFEFTLKFRGKGLTANNPNLLTPVDSFSTDTALLQYAPSSLYTLTTLANAPVGTFITFTYAANTNTRTQTTTAPTQSTADMNVNGIRLFGRAFSAASTAANPSVVAIQVGKGLRGRTLDGFASTGKTTSVLSNYFVLGSAQYGVQEHYDDKTGILTLDCGYVPSGSTSNFALNINTNTSVPDGYLTINASKSPALTGVPLVQPRIATLSDVKASGTVGGTSTTGVYVTRTLNTISDQTGIIKALAGNQFTLLPGEYYIEAVAPAYRVNGHRAKLRNVSDGVDVILGSSAYSPTINAGLGTVSNSHIVGSFTITSEKNFEIQHRAQTAVTTTDFGVASSTGDNETYTIVKITKVK